MKKIAYILLAFLMIGASSTYAQKSPPKKVDDKIGATQVVIDYHSPSVRGREVYGGLEKWGKVWRAGANQATTIEFSTDVSINGEKLKAGKYAFFVTPMQEGKWLITFNTVPDQWGAYKHDKSKDALVTKAETKAIEHVEELTYGVDGDMIYLDWATTRLHFKVETL